MGLLIEVAQSLLLLGIFYLMFTVMGLRSMMIRGDFVLFLLTGIFLFLTHNKAVSAAMGSVAPLGGMTQHWPMNTAINTLASIIAGLYMQVLAFALILTVVHTLGGGLEIYDPMGMIFPIFMAWASGVAIGLTFGVLKPFSRSSFRWLR